ncbi:hypothetical protein P9126_02610 [Bacillus glycinifermentans]|uniref:hypothetical protein n=1 Tax=Bacillus glycinifermentans TaxID=1664069 RepID=UPI002DB8F48A|nr:hypothetical protein [Bacillus glycinifermentans]MEC3605914.1 hypothetical protein [Bacillus glycinifermentans]
MRNAALKLARDILRIDNEIKYLAKQGPLNFEVREERGKGIVEVSLCVCGCCSIDERVFDSFDKARLVAANMTFQGKEPAMTCLSRYQNLIDSWICEKCGCEKGPVWKDAPGLAKFCPICDEYTGSIDWVKQSK